MQLEGHVAGDGARPAVEDLAEADEATLEGGAEPALLDVEHLEDEVAVAAEIGVRRAHLRHDGFGHLGHHLLLDAERVGPPHGPADEAAQHVAPVLVRGEDPVADEEGGGAGVVGQDAQADVDFGVAAVGPPGGRRGHLEQRREEVRLEDRVDALQDAEQAFVPGAGVDVPAGKGIERAVGLAVVLGEDQVPELEEALVATVGRAAVGAKGGAPVEVDLGAGPAGPGVAHGPEVLVVVEPHALDALLRDRRQVEPELLGLVVGVVHRDPEELRVEAEPLSDQLPGQLDGTLLEVVAEAEVAEHLEEGDVAAGPPDVLDVVVLAHDPHALLDRGDPRVGRVLLAQEVGQELGHAGVGEQRRPGVVGDETGAGQGDVGAVDEVARPGAPEPVGRPGRHEAPRLPGPPRLLRWLGDR